MVTCKICFMFHRILTRLIRDHRHFWNLTWICICTFMFHWNINGIETVCEISSFPDRSVLLSTESISDQQFAKAFAKPMHSLFAYVLISSEYNSADQGRWAFSGTNPNLIRYVLISTDSKPADQLSLVIRYRYNANAATAVGYVYILSEHKRIRKGRNIGYTIYVKGKVYV